MPTFLLKKNNAKSRLAAPLTAGATTLTVKFASPFPLTGNFMITIWDRQNYSDPGDDSTMEILKVTGVSGNTFTVERGQENTIAQAHSNNQYVEHLITAYQITELENEINLLHTLLSGENHWDRQSGSDTIIPVIANSNLDIGTGIYSGDGSGIVNIDGQNIPFSQSGFEADNLNDAVEELMTKENLWDRVGTTLFTHYLNDNIDIGTGNLTCNVLNYSSLNPAVDLTTLVPYTGATGAVDLGIYNLTTTGVINASAYNIPTKKVVCETFTSTGINACIDALGADGGEVYLPEGEYAIDSTITIDQNNTSLVGAGAGSYLNATTYNGNVISCNGKTDLFISHLEIRGSAGSGFAQHLIYDGGFNTCKRVTIEACNLLDSDDKAIAFVTTAAGFGAYHKIIGNYIENADNESISVQSGNNTIAFNNIVDSGSNGVNALYNYNEITNNKIINPGGHGIYCGTAGLIAYNVVYSAGFNGIQTAGNLTSVNNNRVFESARDGFFISNNDWGSVCGNVTQGNGNGYCDIEVFATHNTTISNNMLRAWGGKAEWGIYLRDSDECSIGNNVSDAHDTGGIYLDASSTNNIVTHNNLEGEAVAKITDAGSNNTVINSTASETSYYGDISLVGDSYKTYYGLAKDASIYYDGTDLCIDSQEVGSGHIILNSSKTTTGDPTGVEGKIYWNTIDNVIKMYADGGWRTLASW